MQNKFSLGIVVILFGLFGCVAQETHKTIAPERVKHSQQPYNGVRIDITIGLFQNRSDYMRGLFSSNSDKLGNQSKTILKTHLQQSNRFNVMDRQNLEGNTQEAERLNLKQNIKGARYTITGNVTEFGRKVTGHKMLFGILGSGKKQSAYAKVSLNVVDVLTSQIVHSVQGAGEYTLSNEELFGFGGSAGYDATLNGKVLNLAIMEAVNNITDDIQNGTWQINK
ncbi:putative lipoprotein [uncultured Gammaproteobacteria bacterium]|uniref:CsgG/HfaB family protein n=1 Tax=Bathymodiolus heckerae thiotrophic gill symbiont TaxID=1052212 RepID=UPI0010B4F6F2|nr:CsgG/HfaB family protein [Bathymodiolus heckerae thiotrophic gill symbiont]CAC9441654.1 putative lipoprotein [uncultured Gammaproteobacteria bacterium]SMN13668.1 Probable lipoprotein [Bathymodiolus heckerae thiotrophic gill symbiont]